MTSDPNKELAVAARAAGMTTDEFAKRVRAILRNARCRDTSKHARVFTTSVMQALNSNQ